MGKSYIHENAGASIKERSLASSSSSSSSTKQTNKPSSSLLARKYAANLVLGNEYDDDDSMSVSSNYHEESCAPSLQRTTTTTSHYQQVRCPSVVLESRCFAANLVLGGVDANTESGEPVMTMTRMQDACSTQQQGDFRSSYPAINKTNRRSLLERQYSNPTTLKEMSTRQLAMNRGAMRRNSGSNSTPLCPPDQYRKHREDVMENTREDGSSQSLPGAYKVGGRKPTTRSELVEQRQECATRTGRPILQRQLERRHVFVLPSSSASDEPFVLGENESSRPQRRRRRSLDPSCMDASVRRLQSSLMLQDAAESKEIRQRQQLFPFPKLKATHCHSKAKASRLIQNLSHATKEMAREVAFLMS